MASRISNTEWGLVIGAVLTVEAVQALLTILLIGPFLNPLITFFTVSSLALYYKIRGVKLDTKKALTLAGVSLVELIPLVDVLPAMTLDVVMTMLWDKADQKLHGSREGNDATVVDINEYRDRRPPGRDREAA